MCFPRESIYIFFPKTSATPPPPFCDKNKDLFVAVYSIDIKQVWNYEQIINFANCSIIYTFMYFTYKMCSMIYNLYLLLCTVQ